MRLAFYGGSFNPAHVGHLQPIVQALAQTDAEKVLVAPVFVHPEGKELAPFEHRVQMCELLVQRLASSRVAVSDVEKQAHAHGSYGITADTLRFIFDSRYWSPSKVYLMVGSDIEVERWEGYSEIKPRIERGQVEVLRTTRTEGTSSTVARRLLKAGDPCPILTREVAAYVAEHGLYK